MEKNDNSGFVVSESQGTYGLSGPPDFSPFVGDLGKVTEEESWTLTSLDNSTFAIFTDSEVRVFRPSSNGQLTLTSVCPTAQKTLRAKFSMSGGFLSTFGPPDSSSDKNFKVWDLRGPKDDSHVVFGLKVNKFPDFEFSPDEKTFARLSNNSILFFQVPDFEKVVKKTPEGIKIANFSISPFRGGGGDQFFVICFIKATTGPSSVRLFAYPDLVTPIASKSFFQASRVRTVWSPDGASVLIVTAAEIDRTRTGEPMYGNTLLHFMNIKGVAMSVTTGSSGSSDSNAVHGVEWSPTSTEFCLITGATPRTRAVLMNNKCEKIFDIPMSASAKNLMSFSPGGTHLLLCTLGIQEKVECWEVKGKRSILQLLTPDLTHFFWLSDGVHFMTATMSPQMVLRNGFKVWDLSGKCLKEWKTEQKLLGITPLLFRQTITGMPTPSTIDSGKPVPIVAGDKDKQIRGLKKKLGDIEKLKDILKTGKTLEKNQLDKLEKEKCLVAELRALELS